MGRRRSNPREPRPGEHYFAADPSVVSEPRRIIVELDDLTLELDTDRGVFSHGRVDPGTELLLRQGGPPRCEPGEHLLDLGCGAGVIATVLAHRAPSATVWAVDVNRRALQWCQSNADRLGYSQIHAVQPHEVPDDVRFREIWSNPPVRIGKAALHSLLETWLARLMPSGRAVLVMSRHLGADSLATWLNGHGFEVTRRASSRGYRILELQPRRIDDHATS